MSRPNYDLSKTDSPTHKSGTRGSLFLYLLAASNAAATRQVIYSFLAWRWALAEPDHCQQEGSKDDLYPLLPVLLPTRDNTNHYHRLITGITANIEIMCVYPKLAQPWLTHSYTIAKDTPFLSLSPSLSSSLAIFSTSILPLSFLCYTRSSPPLSTLCFNIATYSFFLFLYESHGLTYIYIYVGIQGAQRIFAQTIFVQRITGWYRRLRRPFYHKVGQVQERAPQTKRIAPPVIFLKDLRRRRGTGGGFRSLLGAGIPRTREEGRGRASAGRNPSSLFCANSSRLRRGSPTRGTAFAHLLRPDIFSFGIVIISQKVERACFHPLVHAFYQGRGEKFTIWRIMKLKRKYRIVWKIQEHNFWG